MYLILQADLANIIVFWIAVFFLAFFAAGRFYAWRKLNKIATIFRLTLSGVKDTRIIGPKLMIYGENLGKEIEKYMITVYLFGIHNILSWTMAKLSRKEDMVTLRCKVNNVKLNFDLINEFSPLYSSYLKIVGAKISKEDNTVLIMPESKERECVKVARKVLNEMKDGVKWWKISVRETEPQVTLDFPVKGMDRNSVKTLILNLIKVVKILSRDH